MTPRSRERGQRRGAFLGRHEIRRHQVELALGLAERGLEERQHVQLPALGRVQDLRRIVLHHARRRPFEREAAGEELRGQRRRAHRLEVARRLRGRVQLLPGGAHARRAVRVGRGHEARRRVGGGAVPVRVEPGRHLAHHGADGDDVEVGERDRGFPRRNTRRRRCGRRRS